MCHEVSGSIYFSSKLMSELGPLDCDEYSSTIQFRFGSSLFACRRQRYSSELNICRSSGKLHVKHV